MIRMNVKIAMAALSGAKVRTILTMMGIIIGVGSVTLIMALGEGIKHEVGSEIDKFGSQVVQIRPGQLTSNVGQLNNYAVFSSFGPSSLSQDDITTAKHTKGVANAAPLMLVTGDVSRGKTTLKNPFVVATSADLPKVLNISTNIGQFFEPSIQDNVVVVGSSVANKLFGANNQIGGQIKIHGTDFTVIGILDDKNTSSIFGGLGQGIDDTLFIPFAAGQQFYPGSSQVQQIDVKLQSGQKPSDVIAALQKNILKEHNGQHDFSVATQQQALDATTSIIRVLTNFTAAIAAVSLLVGGIGIMNIMLVSVTERTREIGIRKSIGATNGQILGQFLIEAVVISVGGGLLGIAFAYAVGGLLNLELSITPIITLSSVLLAFGVSTVIGIVFGIAPALKASRKDPIEALRYE
jgi:putative ABC transport system permease protein